jgi:hypothetical protein
MMIDLEEIRKEIVGQNNVLVSKDDPILMVATLNDAVLREYVDLVTSKNEEHINAAIASLTNTLQQSNIETKKIASRVITESGNYARDQVRAATEEYREQIKHDLRHVAKGLAAVRDDIEIARKTAVIAAVASCFFAVSALAFMFL